MEVNDNALMLLLPWGPSANKYYRSIPNGKYVIVKISEQGREYKETVWHIVQRTPGAIGFCEPSTKKGGTDGDRLKMTVVCHPKTRRGYDLDNRMKAIQDSVAEAMEFDDGQIDFLTVRRGELSKESEGYVEVWLEKIDGDD